MNSFGFVAQAALICWIPVSLLAFLLMRPEHAALFSIFGGVLFLPELVDFKIPLFPAFSKSNIPYLCVLLGCILRSWRGVLQLPKERWVTLLTLVILVGGLG